MIAWSFIIETVTATILSHKTTSVEASYIWLLKLPACGPFKKEKCPSIKDNWGGRQLPPMCKSWLMWRMVINILSIDNK